ncbi:putative glycosyl hydrolase [Escherichia coli]|uniref:Putative glycosyl hydrolase n=1 Tax=Escherichia coli TaxID=562 RepID=A0A485JMC9_ECOLX|nr:putative glycosyl hydrolase [Escherichia coli]
MDTPRPQLLDFQFHQNNDSLTLRFQGRLILTHSKDNPCLWIGSGIADIDMFRGNFSIKDKLQEKIALTDATVSQSPDGWLIHFSRVLTLAPRCVSLPTNRAVYFWNYKTTTLTTTVSGCALPLNQRTISTAAVNNSPTLICAANRSRYGPVNKALVATSKPMSPGRPTAKRTRAATITGLSSHSLRLSARRSITAMLITVAT